MTTGLLPMAWAKGKCKLCLPYRDRVAILKRALADG